MDGTSTHPDRMEAVRRQMLVLTWVAVVLGMGLRFRQYLSQPSYWHDEAMLVLNIFEKDALGLLDRLDAAQTPQAAPPGFLLAQHEIYKHFGRSELAMRFIPLASGLFAMALFAGLAWRFFGPVEPRAAPFVVLLFACSERVLWHTAEAKQYSVDVLVAVMMLWTALGLRDSWTPAQRLLASAALASVTIWFSHATLFMFGGISLALFPALMAIPTRRGAAVWLGCNALFAASFLTVYFISIRDQQAASLYEYWKDEFVDYSRPLMIPVWLIRELGSVCNYALDLGGPLLLPLTALGAWAMWRAGERVRMAVLVLPAALVLCAAAVHAYPFGGSRLTVFLAPMVLLLGGMGVVALRSVALGYVGRLWLAVPVYLVVVAGLHATTYLVHPPRRGNIAPVVQHIRQHWKPGDVVLSNKPQEFRCYSTDLPVRGTTTLEQDIPDGRFWLALSYVERNRDEVVPPIEKRADTEADRREIFSVPGGTAMLFEGVAHPSTSSARTAAW